MLHRRFIQMNTRAVLFVAIINVVLLECSADNVTESIIQQGTTDIPFIVSTLNLMNHENILTFSKFIDIPIGAQDYTTIQSLNYPNPYPPGEFEWTVSEGGGYGVEIIVRNLDLDGSSDDYLLIKPGSRDDDSIPPILFTWKLKSEKKYKLLHKDEFYIKFSAKSNANTYKGFKIDIKRIADIPTTTEPPTTTIGPVLIQPYENSTLYVYGRNHHDFWANVSVPFRYILAEAAIDYCRDKNIEINQTIEVVENVIYYEVGPCFMNWVDSEKCTFVKYSIAVNNDSNNYELTSAHLDEMWLNYVPAKNLSDLGLQLYYPPDDFMVVLIWILVFIGVMIVFIVLLCIIWRTDWFDAHVRPMFMDDEDEIKFGDESLFPTPHQTVPPLFGLDTYSQDDFWNTEMPPEYTEKDSNFISGVDNVAYARDFNDSDEEIIMSLPDFPKDSNITKLRPSIDTLQEESNT